MTERVIKRQLGSSIAGVASNKRMTSLTGALLFVMLGLMGITVLRVRALLPEHLLLGFLLIPPIGLKIATTGYRFVRYYTRDVRYRNAGPPALMLRLIAPIVVVSTVVLFATGIELWLFGLRFGSIWVAAHKLSFLIWLPFTAVHVMSYLGTSGQAVVDELSAGMSGDALQRRSLLVASLVAGVVLAAASLTYASPFVYFGEG